VLSSDAKLAEGIKWSCMILDELHVQKSTMWQTVKGGGVSRQQPLMVAISTAGVYDETSIGWEQWQYSDRVRRGDVDNWAYFAVQYCANENDDWTDPETWRKANPSYGEVLREDALRELYDEARDNPSEQPNFKRYHLNQWVQSLSIWIARDKWDACADETLTEESLHGRMCYGAMDMSSTDDMTALALWFPGKEDEPESLLEWFWLPGDNINEMAEKNNAPYAACWSPATPRIGSARPPVRSGALSPTLNTNIGSAYVELGLDREGEALELDVRGKRQACTVCELPFYSRTRKKKTK